MHGIQITAAEAVTAVGWTAASTAASVRAGISRIFLHDLYPDEEGHPLSVAPLPGDEGFADPFDRIAPAAIGALRALMKTLDARYDEGRPRHLLLGAAHPDRSGSLYEKPEDLLPVAMASELATLFQTPPVQVFPHGNPSGLFAFEAASEIIAGDPRALCVVGAIDSLLNEGLLERLEDGERLKSEGDGSPHGISPGEAVGLVLVESTRFTTSRAPLAVVGSVVTGHEPHPYSSKEPTLAEGLTAVCEGALREARLAPSDVDTVLIDLDGEYHRSAEWSNTEVRCLGSSSRARRLIHPADSYGSIGAASGIVQAAIVTSSRGWLDGVDLVLASDNEGPRGAAVLQRRWRGN
ncbi:MAG: hypothetical protein AAGF11_20940 [Myxococcota bacterium]